MTHVLIKLTTILISYLNLRLTGVNGDVHPNEAHEQMESSHMTGSAAQLQRQNMAASARNENPKNDGNSRHIVRIDAFHQNQGFDSNTGSPSACFPTLPHNAPAR
uniref:Uncharacterized protein n=1 Tax=Aegilops tauschii subsp. strangulata TaxID=200361 RepID=A0A453EIC8_AEGTS